MCKTFKTWIDVQGIHDDYFGGVKYLDSEARRLYPDAQYGKLMKSIEERIIEMKRRADIVKTSQK